MIMQSPLHLSNNNRHHAPFNEYIEYIYMLGGSGKWVVRVGQWLACAAAAVATVSRSIARRSPAFGSSPLFCPSLFIAGWLARCWPPLGADADHGTCRSILARFHCSFPPGSAPCPLLAVSSGLRFRRRVVCCLLMSFCCFSTRCWLLLCRQAGLLGNWRTRSPVSGVSPPGS